MGAGAAPPPDPPTGYPRGETSRARLAPEYSRDLILREARHRARMSARHERHAVRVRRDAADRDAIDTGGAAGVRDSVRRTRRHRHQERPRRNGADRVEAE